MGTLRRRVLEVGYRPAGTGATVASLRSCAWSQSQETDATQPFLMLHFHDLVPVIMRSQSQEKGISRAICGVLLLFQDVDQARRTRAAHTNLEG